MGIVDVNRIRIRIRQEGLCTSGMFPFRTYRSMCTETMFAACTPPHDICNSASKDTKLEGLCFQIECIGAKLHTNNHDEKKACNSICKGTMLVHFQSAPPKRPRGVCIRSGLECRQSSCTGTRLLLSKVPTKVRAKVPMKACATKQGRAGAKVLVKVYSWSACTSVHKGCTSALEWNACKSPLKGV